MCRCRLRGALFLARREREAERGCAAFFDSRTSNSSFPNDCCMILQHGTVGEHWVCAQRRGREGVNVCVLEGCMGSPSAAAWWPCTHRLQLEPELRHGAHGHAAGEYQSNGAVHASIGVADAVGESCESCDIRILGLCDCERERRQERSATTASRPVLAAQALPAAAALPFELASRAISSTAAEKNQLLDSREFMLPLRLILLGLIVLLRSEAWTRLRPQEIQAYAPWHSASRCRGRSQWPPHGEGGLPPRQLLVGAILRF